MRPPRSTARALLDLAGAALLAGCFPTVDEIRLGEPAMRATFAAPAEEVTECLARAWESVRVRWGGGPLRVTSRFVAGTGTIVVEVPRADGIPLLVEVSRAAGGGAMATAWSRRTTVIDSQAAFEGAMQRAVAACRGEPIEGHNGGDPPRPARPG